MSLFQPPGVHKEPGMGQIHQSYLCCCLDNTSPRLAFTSTSTAASDVPCQDLKSLFLCRHARVHQEERSFFTRKSTSPLKNVLAKALLTFSPKSTHSQDRACKCTGDFYSQVTSPLSSSHLGRLATVARVSLCVAVILLLRA